MIASRRAIEAMPFLSLVFSATNFTIQSLQFAVKIYFSTTISDD